MPRSTSKVVAVAVLAVGLAGLATADDKKPTGPDWSGYVTASTVTGEVAAADEEGLTLKVTELVPYSTRSSRGRMSVKAKTEDLRLTYADGGLVRWKAFPPKLDEKGKRLQYTDKELKELRSPVGAPGFAAERSVLEPGHLVEVTLVRPKEIPSAKVTFQDLKVKYAVIVGTDPAAVMKKMDATKKGGEKKKE